MMMRKPFDIENTIKSISISIIISKGDVGCDQHQVRTNITPIIFSNDDDDDDDNDDNNDDDG